MKPRTEKKQAFATKINNFDADGIQAFTKRLFSTLTSGPAKVLPAKKPAGVPPPTAPFKGLVTNLIATDSQKQPKAAIAEILLAGG